MIVGLDAFGSKSASAPSRNDPARQNASEPTPPLRRMPHAQPSPVVPAMRRQAQKDSPALLRKPLARHVARFSQNIQAASTAGQRAVNAGQRAIKRGAKAAGQRAIAAGNKAIAAGSNLASTDHVVGDDVPQEWTVMSPRIQAMVAELSAAIDAANAAADNADNAPPDSANAPPPPSGPRSQPKGGGGGGGDGPPSGGSDASLEEEAAAGKADQPEIDWGSKSGSGASDRGGGPMSAQEAANAALDPSQAEHEDDAASMMDETDGGARFDASTDPEGGFPPTDDAINEEGEIDPAAYLNAYSMQEMVGLDALGMLDVATTQKQLDIFKAMSVDQARVALKHGQTVINLAISGSKRLMGNLPGDSTRQNVKWKLKWHEDALAKLVARDKSYGAADDLKKWVQQAFIEFDAVEEGTAYAQENWDAMIRDIGAAIAALPDTIPSAIASAIPWYVWAGGAAVVCGGLLFYFGPILLPYMVASKRAR